MKKNIPKQNNLKLKVKDFSLGKLGENKNKERAFKSSFRIIVGVVLNLFWH
ncbi:hypothetical protein [Flavobacterium sp.]|uniref:hypothetical protein n=1 Tax=Flavobacterium sp. TaxID=239 RepID=UPI0031D1DC2C